MSLPCIDDFLTSDHILFSCQLQSQNREKSKTAHHAIKNYAIGLMYRTYLRNHYTLLNDKNEKSLHTS
jgi:hypothetical protein